MPKRPFITFDQARAAINAMSDQATQPPVTPVAMTIVDEAGNLIAYAHMDNLRLFSKRHSIRKAYTSAITGTDSGANGDRLKSAGGSISDLGDSNITPAQGGVVVLSKNSEIMGGIGVAGCPSGEEDEALARVGLSAMSL